MKIKRILSFVLICTIISTTFSTKVLAIDSQKQTDINLSSYSEQYKKENFELIEDNIYNKVIYTYEENGKKYKVEERASQDLSEVNSQLYVMNALGEYVLEKNIKTKFIVEKQNENLKSSTVIKAELSENGECIDIQYIPLMNDNLNEFEYQDNTIDVKEVPTYKWVYDGFYQGNTKIVRYTVTGVVALLGTIAGVAVGGGFATQVAINVATAIAYQVVSDNIPLLWWSSNIWRYRMYNGIFWVDVGNKELTYFYSDSNRTQLIDSIYDIDV